MDFEKDFNAIRSQRSRYHTVLGGEPFPVVAKGFHGDGEIVKYMGNQNPLQRVEELKRRVLDPQ